eukprot:CAMPEP_0202702250 /NCGR_PEP_ID=MMETSP1385-20130828/15268_1 /ASSEMBLY_ACC=CAM_ASM_000861 /TAXON_ID=933848 /ORGANISM="Elphidium margaritaceum" /LENGTH=543 /DNA_ID=CAMNT_0049359867 /DNA_START=38 /DNA_END=1669 /DNA_ORIENTATION=+
MDEEDERIMREFQRLSVSGFDEMPNFEKEREAHIQQHGYRYSNGNQLSPFVTASPSSHKYQYNLAHAHNGHDDDDDDDDDDNDNIGRSTFSSSSSRVKKSANHSNSGSDDGGDQAQTSIDADALFKFHRYIYDKSDYDQNADSPLSRDNNHTHIHRHRHRLRKGTDEELSVDDIINDLKRRKARRLKRTKTSALQSNNAKMESSSMRFPPTSTSSPPLTYSIFKTSRFMQAANASQTHDLRQQKALTQQMEGYKQTIERQEHEIKALRKQLSEKSEELKTLQYKLLQKHEHTVSNIPSDLQTIYDENEESDEEKDSHEEPLVFTPRTMRHMRQKSQTQTQTEQATIENVRWELRSEISKMASAENEVDRLLQSVGDTSMLHGRLKKIHSTLADHKRKVSAIEQTLNTNEFGAPPAKQFMFDSSIGGASLTEFDEENEELDDEADNAFMRQQMNGFRMNSIESVEQQDVDTIRNEYGKLKLKIAQLEEDAKDWNHTKTELQNVNKRCNNLMSMLDKLSDEKMTLTLKIEDLQALLHKNNIQYSS